MAPITIDKNIEMPDRPGSGGGSYPKYPWKTMDIGDSFLFPAEMKEQSVRSLPYEAGKTHGRKFTVRKTEEGFRCWRIA